jgi:hypothetical protein
MKEFKTYVIWGVPQSHLATRVQESLERLSGPLYNKCYWRGEGGSRHVAAEFHIMPDNTRKNALKMTCKSLGWKAIPARRWKQRCAHRTSRMRDRSSKGFSFPVENRYEIIEPQIQLEEANPANVQDQAGGHSTRTHARYHDHLARPGRIPMPIRHHFAEFVLSSERFCLVGTHTYCILSTYLSLPMPASYCIHDAS